MKSFLKMLMNIVVCVLFIVACLLISKLIFETVVNSDMPDWLKYVILRS